LKYTYRTVLADEYAFLPQPNVKISVIQVLYTDKLY